MHAALGPTAAAAPRADSPPHPPERSRGLLDAVGEVVEERHAVGLGPHADRARPRDMVVLELDAGRAVEGNADARAGEPDRERMPLPRGDGRRHILDRGAAAILRVVERDVVLERIGAGDVVVVAVLPTPDDAAGLILLALERLEPHLHEA